MPRSIYQLSRLLLRTLSRWQGKRADVSFFRELFDQVRSSPFAFIKSWSDLFLSEYVETATVFVVVGNHQTHHLRDLSCLP